MRSVSEWDESDLLALISDGVRESTTVEYKACGALRPHTRTKQEIVEEIGKDISAMANTLSEWVFPGDGAAPMDVNNWRRRQWKRLFEKARMRQVHPHVLRHSYASLLIGQGESLAYVRDQLGHHSIQITVDCYGHLVPSGNRAAVDRLDERAKRSANPAQPEPLAVSGESS